jgi:putative sigma-54 modulation protein
MKIEIRRRGKLPDHLRAYVERRVHFALGRFGHRIQRVTVRIPDVNGPRGGVDQQCRVIADLGSLGRLTVEWVDNSLTAAVDHAADRIARSVARTIERSRDVWTPLSSP